MHAEGLKDDVSFLLHMLQKIKTCLGTYESNMVPLTTVDSWWCTNAHCVLLSAFLVKKLYNEKLEGR